MQSKADELGAEGRSGKNLLAAAGVLLVEYLALSLSYDALPLLRETGAVSLLGSLGTIAPAAAVIAAVLLTIFGSRLKVAWRSAQATSHRSGVGWGWFALHGAAYVALVGCTHRLFSDGTLPPDPVFWAVAWSLAAVLVVAFMGFALLPPRSLFTLLRGVAPLLGSGLGIGGAAWLAGLASIHLWNPLGAVTLYGVAILLQMILPDLVLDPAFAEVGAERFYVRVDQACSGYEGVGLIVVFLAFYLWTARSSLRFPRAFLLLPLAIVTVLASNILRITALILVGIHVSPQVALGGFHSKAGWVLFCAIGLGFVAWSRRSAWFAAAPDKDVRGDNPVSPFLVPLLVVIAVALVTGLFATDLDRGYALRIIGGAAAVLFYRARLSLRLWYPSLEACGIGALVFALWLALAPTPDARDVDTWRAARGRLDAIERTTWTFFKLIGSILLIPIVEELAFRGFLLRRVMSEDFANVSWQRLTWISVVFSSLAFGALHQEWIAGTVAGALFAWVQSRRGNLGEAVFAHAVSNALIAVWVLALGRVDLWM